MPTPVSFPSKTQAFALPLLFAGQAQKEFALNHALTAIDSALQLSVEASLSSPPASVAEGEAYRVTSAASADWQGQEDKIATLIGGTWVFVEPFSGLRLFDRNAGVMIHYESTWESALAPQIPSGGVTIDTEARQMLAELIEALRKIGVFPRET